METHRPLSEQELKSLKIVPLDGFGELAVCALETGVFVLVEASDDLQSTAGPVYKDGKVLLPSID